MAYPGPGGAQAPEVEALHAADARLRHLGAITDTALAHLGLVDVSVVAPMEVDVATARERARG